MHIILEMITFGADRIEDF